MSDPTRADSPEPDLPAQAREPTADAVGREAGPAAQAPPPGGDTPSDAIGTSATVTGDAEIDAALGTLDALDDTPVHEHAAVVERVHRVLQDRLAEGQE